MEVIYKGFKMDLDSNRMMTNYVARMDSIFNGREELLDKLVDTVEGLRRIGKPKSATHLFNTICYHILHHRENAIDEVLNTYRGLVDYYDNNSIN